MERARPPQFLGPLAQNFTARHKTLPWHVSGYTPPISPHLTCPVPNNVHSPSRMGVSNIHILQRPVRHSTSFQAYGVQSMSILNRDK